MTLFYRLGFELQKQGTAAWRTPTGLAAIAKRFRYGGTGTAANRLDLLTAARKAIGIPAPASGPTALPGVNKMLDQAKDLPAVPVAPRYEGSTPPQQLFRGITNTAPFERTQLGAGKAHGTPHPGTAAVYGQRIGPYRLLSQHAAAPRQRYGPDFSLERGFRGLTYSKLQDLAGPGAPILDTNAAANRPRWFRRLPADRDTKSLALLRDPSAGERKLRAEGYNIYGTQALYTPPLTYETKLTPRRNPVTNLSLWDQYPETGSFSLRAVPNTPPWQSFLQQATRYE